MSAFLARPPSAFLPPACFLLPINHRVLFNTEGKHSSSLLTSGRKQREGSSDGKTTRVCLLPSRGRCCCSSISMSDNTVFVSRGSNARCFVVFIAIGRIDSTVRSVIGVIQSTGACNCADLFPGRPTKRRVFALRRVEMRHRRPVLS